MYRKTHEKHAFCCSYYDPFLPDKGSRKKHRTGFDFVKPGSMQKDAEQARIKVSRVPALTPLSTTRQGSLLLSAVSHP